MLTFCYRCMAEHISRHSARRTLWKEIFQSRSMYVSLCVRLWRSLISTTVAPLKLLGEELELPVQLIPQEKREFKEWQVRLVISQFARSTLIPFLS